MLLGGCFGRRIAPELKSVPYTLNGLVPSCISLVSLVMRALLLLPLLFLCLVAGAQVDGAILNATYPLGGGPCTNTTCANFTSAQTSVAYHLQPCSTVVECQTFDTSATCAPFLDIVDPVTRQPVKTCQCSAGGCWTGGRCTVPAWPTPNPPYVWVYTNNNGRLSNSLAKQLGLITTERYAPVFYVDRTQPNGVFSTGFVTYKQLDLPTDA
jgi:hypothetical protein